MNIIYSAFSSAAAPIYWEGKYYKHVYKYINVNIIFIRKSLKFEQCELYAIKIYLPLFQLHNQVYILGPYPMS